MPVLHEVGSTPIMPLGLAPNASVAAGTAHGGTLFQREIESAVERAGGERVQEEHAQELSAARRDRRQAGFERYHERVSDEHRRAGAADEGRPSSAPQSDQAAPTVDAPATDRPARAAVPDPAGSAAQASAGSSRVPARDSIPGSAVHETLPASAALVPASATPAPAVPAPVTGAAAPGGAPAPKGPAPSTAVAPSLPAAERFELPGAPRAGAAGIAMLERAEEILRQLRLAIQPHTKRVVLELEPSELGRMSIRMSLQRGELATVVRVESPETLALLEQRSQELRTLLTERGFDARRMTFELGFGAERHARRDPGSGAGRVHGERPRTDRLHDARRVDPSPTSCPRTDGIDTYA